MREITLYYKYEEKRAKYLMFDLVKASLLPTIQPSATTSDVLSLKLYS